MIKFKCKDFLLKECEFEAKGTHSVDEMMKLIEVHAGEEHEPSSSRRRLLQRFATLWRKKLARKTLARMFSFMVA